MTEETKDNSLVKRTREEIVREIEDTDKQVGEDNLRRQETVNTQWSQQCASEARELRGRVTAFSESRDNVEQLLSEIDRLRQESSSAMPGAWPEIAVKLSQLKVRVDEHVKSIESMKEAHKRLEETAPDWVESLWNAAPGLKEDFESVRTISTMAGMLTPGVHLMPAYCRS